MIAYNSLKKLRSEGKLNIGYLGGSITEAGGSNGRLGWRGRFTDAIKALYPSAEIKEINAGVGGTGSDLGCYRLKQDLLSHKPDMVFIEFAVNDGGASEIRISRSMDGLVRAIMKDNPLTEIVFIYTITKGTFDNIMQGKSYHSRDVMDKVALYYNIPCIDVGMSLGEAINNGETWENLARDFVHPTDKGHEIYFNKIKSDMNEYFDKNSDVSQPYKIKEEKASYSDMPYDSCDMEDACSLCDISGFEKKEKSMFGRYPRFIEGGPGAVFTYSFEGNAIGLYWTVEKDSGKISWQIDGSTPITVSSWDKYALQFGRACYIMLNEQLPFGRHILKVKVLDEKDEQSIGFIVRIGALLVSK